MKVINSVCQKIITFFLPHPILVTTPPSGNIGVGEDSSRKINKSSKGGGGETMVMNKVGEQNLTFHQLPVVSVLTLVCFFWIYKSSFHVNLFKSIVLTVIITAATKMICILHSISMFNNTTETFLHTKCHSKWFQPSWA